MPGRCPCPWLERGLFGAVAGRVPDGLSRCEIDIVLANRLTECLDIPQGVGAVFRQGCL